MWEASSSSVCGEPWMSSMELLSVMWIIGEKSPLVTPRCEGVKKLAKASSCLWRPFGVEARRITSLMKSRMDIKTW
jgi:hypothetical protein